MQAIILVFHVLIAISIVSLVLLQHGKGADIGASFGSGASSTVFGSQGSMPFLFKLTLLLAGLFFTTSLILTYLTDQRLHQRAMLPSSAQVVLPAKQTTQNQIIIPHVATKTQATKSAKKSAEK